MKKLLSIFLVFCGVMLTGCTKMTDITDTESDIMAEYMAAEVLKYDENYMDGLIYPEETSEDSVENTIDDQVMTPVSTNIEPSATPTAPIEDTAISNDSTSTSTSESAESQVTTIEMDLSKDIGKGILSIKYAEYALYDSYPTGAENNYFSLETSADHQLLMVSFKIKNTTDKSELLNLIGTDIGYQLDVNGTVYSPMMTLLVNDIQYINLDIKAGKTTEGVLVFNVVREKDISNIDLTISNQEKSKVINIK